MSDERGKDSDGRWELATALDWVEDCRHWRGEVLTGDFAHWCWDWDGLPVDETTPEWPSCGCFRQASLLEGVG